MYPFITISVGLFLISEIKKNPLCKERKKGKLLPIVHGDFPPSFPWLYVLYRDYVFTTSNRNQCVFRGCKRTSRVDRRGFTSSPLQTYHIMPIKTNL